MRLHFLAAFFFPPKFVSFRSIRFGMPLIERIFGVSQMSVRISFLKWHSFAVTAAFMSLQCRYSQKSINDQTENEPNAMRTSGIKGDALRQLLGN